MEYKEASIYIGIFDTKTLRPVEPPLDLLTDYLFQISIVNHTQTTGGHPWQANFEVGVGISLDGVDILPYTIHPPREFAPGETIKYTSTAYIQSKWAGMSGLVTAKVLDPFGALLASGEKPFTIGFEVSPSAAYEPVVSSELAGVDLPYLNPDEVSEGEVVMTGVGSRPPPQKPSPPTPKKVSYGPPISGIDTRTTPEPKVEFEAPATVDGRIV